MSAQKSILSFFGARATPPPLAPPSKSSATTPPTIASGGSDTCRPSTGASSTLPPVTPLALGQKFSTPAQASPSASSPGNLPLISISRISSYSCAQSITSASLVPSPPSFFAAFGSKQAFTSKGHVQPKPPAVQSSRTAPPPAPAAALADDDDDAPLVSAALPSAHGHRSDDDDRCPTSSNKRPCSPSQLAAKFSRYTAGSSPVESRSSAPRNPLPPRALAGGSGFGSAKFEAANSERYQWLENVRDAQGRKLGEPGYDSRTLFVPKEASKKFTPFENQFWTIKSQNYDVVLFFKKGKFYELYEGDADVGVREFGLKMTDRVNMRMAGVPERSFRKYASGLVRLGYRVGRVEQMETGIAAAQRKEESGGKNSICAREMCQILTCGTLVEEDMLEGPDANLLLIVHEAGDRRFGICLAECSSGEFWLGQFDDDSNYTQLETVLLRHRPREVVWPKDAAGLAMLSKPALKLIKGLLPNASFVALTHETEFWSAERTKTETFTCGCFEPDASGSLQLPPVLSRVLADPASSAALRAWGGALSYLRSLLLEGEVVPGASVADYCEYARPRYMQLDGHTLNNLELLRRPDSFLSAKSDTNGSLLSVIDRTCTAMGRRLLHQWICSPLAERGAILQRQTAVAFFAQSQDALSALTRVLRPLPDLDRAIVRLQAQARKKSHGVMFDDATAREVQGLVAIVDAFYSLAAACTAVKQHLQTHGAPSLVGVSIPATLDSTLSAFVSQFNLKRARSDSTVAPEPGVNPEYDASAASLDGVIAELNSHLEEVKRTTKCKDVDFYSAAHGKEPFQLEFPAAWIDRNGAPASMTIMSQTKTVKRYWDSRTKALVQRYRIAHEAVECAQQGTVRALMAKLSDACAPMKAAVAALAHLDCLMSLSHTQRLPGGPTCLPEFVSDGEGDTGCVIDLKDVRHPCLTDRTAASVVVPNDVTLGFGSSRAMLITGPNMGGKSTLMRSTCLAVILAHMGAFVPCSSARLSVVDRVFTRVGASDKIMLGQSTFMVEMLETASILRHATNRSLVILDELGRGSSTSDGSAIAFAVVQKLLNHSNCAALISTHFHNLVAEIPPSLATPMHMSAIVDEASASVTFLYKLVHGCSGQSFGLHCAAAAGLPQSVISGARSRLEQLHSSTAHESMTDAAQLLRRVLDETDPLLLLQMQQRVRGLTALSTGSYGRDLLV